MEKRVSVSENRWMIILMIVGIALLFLAVVGYVHGSETSSASVAKSAALANYLIV